MQTLAELGESIAARRRSLGLKQSEVAAVAAVAPAVLSRLERGRVAEFGARKLLAILAALGMELGFDETQPAGSLDALRRERNEAR